MQDSGRAAFLSYLLFVIAGCGANSGSFFVPLKNPDALVTFDIFDPPTLDPHRSWGVADGRLIGMLFCNLVQFNRKAEIIPDLAQSWTISEDGTIYTFELNPQAKFANGDSITADDVIYSFERALSEDTAAPNRWALEPVTKMEALDPHTLRLTLSGPFAPFIGQLAMPVGSIIPQNEIEKSERENIPFGTRPVGGGPWRMVEWKHDRHIIFERNPNYWADPPRMATFIYRVIPNHFTAVAEFETGNLSIVEELPDAEIPRWTTDKNWQPYVAEAPQLNTDMVLFNCSKPPLDQPEVRRALVSLVDTEKVLQCVRFGAGTPSGGPIPSSLPGGATTRVPFDMNQEEATKTLREAGLLDRELLIVFPEREGFTRATGEVLQALWKRAGLNARIQQLEWATYRQALREGKFDAAYRSWYADYPDGDNFLYPLFHSSQSGQSNFTFLNDPEVDDLIDASRRELDAAKRISMLERANSMLYQKAPALYLWHRTQYTVRHPHVENYEPTLIFNGVRYLTETITEPESDTI